MKDNHARPIEEAGCRSLTYSNKKCDNCGKTYKWYHSYIKIASDFDKAEFCSYNCRCQYYKKLNKGVN